MKQRILTGLVLAALAVSIILFSPTPLFAAIVGITWLIAWWEWTALAGVTSQAMRIATTVLVATALAGLWFARETPLWWIVIGLGVAWWLVAAVWLRHFSFGASPVRTNRSLKLIAGLFALVPAWAGLMQIHGHPSLGPVWTLFALSLVWAADSFAYFAGRRFGRTKLAPRVSPGKTREGAWGAMAGTALFALACATLLGERGADLVALLVLTVLVVVVSIVGDLFESLLKRQAGVKDSGAIFPGHGGMLDRLDGVFAAIPVFAIGKALIDLTLPA
ncbi:phosphatidate cytidylyltransferase [Dokdonella sp. MW10]|uniref:phosphatidate cytidylyltransferase n=1 Tax=Dokdonella sp. MW10 TaxID=2992926 RepID=UPI003F7CEC60